MQTTVRIPETCAWEWRWWKGGVQNDQPNCLAEVAVWCGDFRDAGGRRPGHDGGAPGLRTDGQRLRLHRAGEGKIRLDGDRKSTRLNSSHQIISYAVFCLKKKTASEYSYSTSARDQNQLY